MLLLSEGTSGDRLRELVNRALPG